MPNPPVENSSIEENAVTLFHADWCGHCKDVMPKWKKLTQMIVKKSGYPPIKMTTVEESDKNKQIIIDGMNANVKGKKLQINGYPTIVRKINGHIDDYKGPREIPDLLKWIYSPMPKEEKQIIHTMKGGKHNRTIKRNKKISKKPTTSKTCKTCKWFPFW